MNGREVEPPSPLERVSMLRRAEGAYRAYHNADSVEGSPTTVEELVDISLGFAEHIERLEALIKHRQEREYEKDRALLYYTDKKIYEKQTAFDPASGWDVPQTEEILRDKGYTATKVLKDAGNVRIDQDDERTLPLMADSLGYYLVGLNDKGDIIQIDGAHTGPEGVAQAMKLFTRLGYEREDVHYVMMQTSPVPDIEVQINENAAAICKRMLDSYRRGNG